jgi:hypothetical protein
MGPLRGIFSLLLSLAALAGLGGCKMVGNGEGYPGVQPEPEPIKNGVYYWIDPTYRCHPAGGGPLVASYRGAIRIQGESRTELGDLCRPTEVAIPASERFDSWGDSDLLGYRLGIYERRETAPSPTFLPEPFTEAWCRQPGKPSVQLTVRTQVESADPVVKITLGANKPPVTFSVARKQGAQFKEYDRPGFLLRIALDAGDSTPSHFKGQLSFSQGGEAHEYLNLECRITP